MSFLLPFRPRILNPTTPAIATATTTTLSHILRSSFSTTPTLEGRHSKYALREVLKGVPPYPYPIKHTFKQSWFGLYDGKHIQFGNNIPDGEYSHKTRRTWKPNVKSKKLYSKALGKFVQITVVTSVLRTIDKVGGLDEYLLSTKPARLSALGPYGWKLRHKVMRTPAIQKRFKQERIALGLEKPPAGKITKAGDGGADLAAAVAAKAATTAVQTPTVEA